MSITKEEAVFPTVLEERSGAVMTIRLNRPEKLNALDVETCRSLVHSLLRAAEDKSIGDIIARAEPERSLNLCGQTSLPEMVEWLRLCDLMVTNDTGPMHAAAALGKLLVALFGPTEPRRTGPYGRQDCVLRLNLPCSPCFKSHCTYEKPEECLKGISPAMVFERVCRQFNPA